MSLSLNVDEKLHLSDDDPQVSPEAVYSAKSESSTVDNKHHLDEIIPPTHPHRTIILCFDGTGDQFSEDVRITIFKGNLPADLSQNPKNSNIVQLFSMLRKDNKSEQMVYYQVRQLLNSIRPLLNHILC
jgi:hypothetical protein